MSQKNMMCVKKITSLTYTEIRAYDMDVANEIDEHEHKHTLLEAPTENRIDRDIQTPIETKSHSQAEFLRNAMKINKYFRRFNENQRERVIELMNLKSFRAGFVLCRQGSDGHMLYILDQGYLEMVRKERNQWNRTLHRPGAVIGEPSVLFNLKWEFSARASTNVKIWCLDKKNFQEALKTFAQVKRIDHVHLLRNVDKFKNVPEVYLFKIVDCLEENAYKIGENIFEKGCTGDNLCIIKEGKLKLTRTETVATQTTLESGDYFKGECGMNAIVESEKASVLIVDQKAVCLLIGSICYLPTISSKVVPTEDEYYNEEGKRTAIEILSKEDEEFITNIPFKKLQLIRSIAKGGYGYVRLVTIPEFPRRSFALKSFRKSEIIAREQLRHTVDEKNIMIAMKSSFIGKMYRTYNDELKVHFLMDAYLGGDLRRYLRPGILNESQAKFCASSVIEAFEYLHSRGIIHRDTKTENLMVDHRGYIKLIDFGFAKYLDPGEKAYTFCGTREYCAPEIVMHKGHDFAVDFWTLGILIYELLANATPFYSHSPLNIYENILKGIDVVQFYRTIPEYAKVLIKSLCKNKPSERIGYKKGGIDDIRKQPWFRGFDWLGMRSHRLPSPFTIDFLSPTDTRNFDEIFEEVEVVAEERKVIASYPINWEELF